MKPRMLDLFAGAGGAGMGYHRAGFEVVGVDLASQPRYPFEFHQADAIHYLAEHWREFDAVHASPPCQAHSRMRARWGNDHRDTIPATRGILDLTGLPYVIENVPGAPLRADFLLCGCLFDLPGLRRERLFETNWADVQMRPPCHHVGRTITVAGHPGGKSTRDGLAGFGTTAQWKRAMGIDWMTASEMAQAIPPAYTELIGRQLLNHLTEAAA